MLTRRRQLIELLTGEKNRLKTAVSVQVRTSIEEHIAWLEKRIKDIDTDMRMRIQNMPEWREKDKIIQSVPGGGPVLVLTLS